MPRVTTKGQVTIPIAIREQVGIYPGHEVEFDVHNGYVRLRKIRGNRGREIVEHLRRHSRKGAMTTDEIMALTRGE